MKKLFLLSIITLPSIAHAQVDSDLLEALNKLPGTKPVDTNTLSSTTLSSPFNDFSRLDADKNEGLIRLARYNAYLRKGTLKEDEENAYIAQKNLAEGYLTRARTSKQVSLSLGSILGKYYTEMAETTSAPQITHVSEEANVRLTAVLVGQNQRIIEQNDEIIQLLKIQANKK